MINHNLKHNDAHLYSFITQRGRIISMSDDDMENIAKIYNNNKLKDYILETNPTIKEDLALHIADNVNFELNEILGNSDEYTKLENNLIKKYLELG